MATRARMGRRPRLAAPQRKRVWASQLGSFTGVDGTEQSMSLVSQFQTDYGAQLVGSTIARTFVTFRFDASATAGGGGLIVGLIRVGSLGAAGPIDIAGRHDDWSLIRAFWPDPATATDTTPHGVGEIDLKAMRKLEELDEDYQIFVQATGGDTWNVQFQARTLILLP